MSTKSWIILAVSALTDGLIALGGGISSAMVAQNAITMPTTAVFIVSGIAGAMAALRTLQQGIRKIEGTTP